MFHSKLISDTVEFDDHEKCFILKQCELFDEKPTETFLGLVNF